MRTFSTFLLCSFLLFPASSLFAQSEDPPRSGGSWEVGVSVQRAFLTDGDLSATGAGLHVSRHLRGDLGLQASHHRVETINRNVQGVLEGGHGQWADRRQTGGSVALLWRPIQFNTENVSHAARVEAGPVFQVQRGETVRGVTHAPKGGVEETLDALEGDHMYVVGGGQDTHIITTNTLDRTGLGAMLGVSYGLTYDQLTFRLRLSSEFGGEERGMVHQAGVAFGVRL
jgi:hypothetical protein